MFVDLMNKEVDGLRTFVSARMGMGDEREEKEVLVMNKVLGVKKRCCLYVVKQ